MMLRTARINAEWVPVPSAEMIREQDQERLFTAITAPVDASELDQALAARIAEKMSPTEVALALVAAHKSRMPEPEDLIDLSNREGVPGKPDHHRAGFDDVVWFRMDIGRRQNADPRWLLPLLCRRGHITRNEIGAIRIAPNETHFQVPRAIEAKFRDAVKRTANPGAEDESGITIELAPDSPREVARDNVRQHKPRGEAPRPHRKGPHKPVPYKAGGKKPPYRTP
jgi:ATP-dependent RNA helicase DeaD